MTRCTTCGDEMDGTAHVCCPVIPRGQSEWYIDPGDVAPQPLISLRDHFALAALPSILNEAHLIDLDGEETRDQAVARMAYKAADAMLAERARRRP